MKITKKVSFSAILIAIAVVILYLGSMIDVLTLSVAALASLTVMITVAELGFPSAFCVYCAASFTLLSKGLPIKPKNTLLIS